MNGPTRAERMSGAARDMQDEADPRATMQTAAALACEFLQGCDAAAISVVERRGRIETLAYTDELALRGDALQYELREGPCLDAIWEDPLVHAPDLGREPRWPTWSPQVAARLGARSMMCFRLWTHQDTVGGLNLYSRSAHAFDANDRDEGIALAAHIAVAVADARDQQNLVTALDTRTVIGQATGILMERHGLAPDQAFGVLVRISSHRNAKLSAIAQHLVTTRELLDDPVGP